MADAEDTVVEITESDEEMYVDYDITSYPSDNTLSGLRDMWKAGDIEVPDFQRGFVWNIKQASLLIESFLRGLPVPPIFFFVDPENKSLVVDGQQRLKSIIYFFEGYFGPPSKNGRRQIFKLTALNEKSKYANKLYTDLTEAERRKFDNSVLRAINIRQMTPSADISSVYHIFERLNTGGTPLSPQEIRNTVYRGLVVSRLRDANDDVDWRAIIGKPDRDRRERDVEILLRLLSLFQNGASYETPMKKFLNDNMSVNRKKLTASATKFFDRFPEVTEFIVSEAGEKPFSPNGPLNVAVLDAVFTALMQRWPSKPKGFADRVGKLLGNKTFVDLTSSRTADTDIVKRRLKMAQAALI